MILIYGSKMVHSSCFKRFLIYLWFMKPLEVTKPAFFSFWVFFHEHSRFTGQQGKGEGIYLIPVYHYHPFHRQLDISRAIAAESSPLHIASSRNRTGNLCFRAQVASYAPPVYLETEVNYGRNYPQHKKNDVFHKGFL